MGRSHTISVQYSPVLKVFLITVLWKEICVKFWGEKKRFDSVQWENKQHSSSLKLETAQTPYHSLGLSTSSRSKTQEISCLTEQSQAINSQQIRRTPCGWWCVQELKDFWQSHFCHCQKWCCMYRAYQVLIWSYMGTSKSAPAPVTVSAKREAWLCLSDTWITSWLCQIPDSLVLGQQGGSCR